MKLSKSVHWSLTYFPFIILVGSILRFDECKAQSQITWNDVNISCILYPFGTRFIDHIFPSWNFRVSLSSDKVKAKVWSVPLEPGFSPRGEVGISRGMGVIPPLPGLLLLAQTFLPSSLGAMQGSVCTLNVYSTSVVQIQEHLLMLEHEYY